MNICNYFEVCGGCLFQDIDYSEELLIKKRHAQFHLWKNKVDLVVSIPQNTGCAFYRTRMDFCFSEDGFALKKANQWKKKVAIDNCNIASPIINTTLAALNYWVLALPYPPLKNTLKFATLRCAVHKKNFSITFILNQESACLGEVKNYIHQFSKEYTARQKHCSVLIGFIKEKSEVSYSSKIEVVAGNVMLQEKLLGKEILFHTQGFFQNNIRMFEAMLTFVAGCIKHFFAANNSVLPMPTSAQQISTPPTWQISTRHNTNYILWDLYGGCGSFSVALSHLFKTIVLIELEESNIVMAEQNRKTVEANGVKYKIFKGDVAKLLSSSTENTVNNTKQLLQFPLAGNNENNDENNGENDDENNGENNGENNVVIVDPPRAGLGAKGIASTMRLKPKLLIYISCNIEKLAQEINTICNYGYNITSHQLFDFFPRTPHLETVVIFQLKNKR